MLSIGVLLNSLHVATDALSRGDSQKYRVEIVSASARIASEGPRLVALCWNASRHLSPSWLRQGVFDETAGDLVLFFREVYNFCRDGPFENENILDPALSRT